MKRGPDSGQSMTRAIFAAAAAMTVDIVESESWPWASATFTGARHRIRLTLPDTPESRHWLAGLPEHEFTIRGHLVADLVLVEQQHRDGLIVAVLETLTVEDG